MQKRFLNLLITGLVASTVLSTTAFAQTDPDHPRVNEVNGRVDNQQSRIDNGVADGQITPNQAAHDEKRDAKVERQESRDEAKHGGHLTKKEQHHLNKKLNKNSADIKNQRAQ